MSPSTVFCALQMLKCCASCQVNPSLKAKRSCFNFTRLAWTLLPLFSVSWLSGPLLREKMINLWYIVYIKAAESYIWPCPFVPQPCSLWGNALQCRVIWPVYDTDMCVYSNVSAPESNLMGSVSDLSVTRFAGLYTCITSINFHAIPMVLDCDITLM